MTTAKQRILDAAFSLLRDRGYHGTSVDDIAAAAGVAKGSVFYHFGSKKNLLIVLFRQTADTYFNEIETRLPDGAAPLEFIQRYAAQSEKLFPGSHSVLTFLLECIQVAIRDPDIRREITRMYEQRIEKFAAILRSGMTAAQVRACDPHGAARALYFLSMGSFLMAFATDPGSIPEAQHRASMDVLLHGLAHPATNEEDTDAVSVGHDCPG